MTSQRLVEDYAERWAPIPGYEGQYEVSDLGRVQSLSRLIKGPQGLRRIRSRILKTEPDSHGYRRLNLYTRDGRKSLRKVHALMLEAFVGPRPTGAEALHTDDKPDNNTLPNLRWGTRSENELDKVRNGNHHNARKTHCKRGHPLEGENLKRKAGGKRECITCLRKSQREYMRRRRAGAAA